MEVTLDMIKRLVVSHESVDVEFKKTTGQINRGMETLCGMMNGDGGMVIFGVTDTGVIKGQEIGDKTTREIGEALSRFEPSITIQPKYVPVDSDKYLIVFSIDSQPTEIKPFQWGGRAYQRHDSVTTVMPLEKLSRMLEKSKGGLRYRWEGEINENLTIADLDEEKIINAVRGGVRRGRLNEAVLNESIGSILARFKVKNGDKLCNAAAVLFGKSLLDYSQCMIRLARFNGNNKNEFIDNIQLEGNVYELLDAAMAFFFKHLSLHGKVERLEREDELEVPYKALRECCVNALAHRAWQRETSTIGIAIFDDTIEIENAGRFTFDLSPDVFIKDEEVLRGHASEPPNPIIAQVMYLSGQIEKWGRGLAMMYDECKRVGIPEPKIVEIGNCVKVIFQRPKYCQSPVKVPSESSRDTAGTQSGHSRDTVGTQYEPSSRNIDKVILTIGSRSMTAIEIREKLGFKSKQRFNENYLRPAIEEGAVIMENSTERRASNQRYLLTEKGLAYYDAHKKS